MLRDQFTPHPPVTKLRNISQNGDTMKLSFPCEEEEPSLCAAPIFSRIHARLSFTAETSPLGMRINPRPIYQIFPIPIGTMRATLKMHEISRVPLLPTAHPLDVRGPSSPLPDQSETAHRVHSLSRSWHCPRGHPQSRPLSGAPGGRVFARVSFSNL